MDQIELLEEAKKNPLPTPPVGFPVQWYENNDQSNPRAAIVVKVEEPGKLSLTVLPPNGMPRHIQGCWHCSHDIHQIRGNNNTFRSGSWGYTDGKPPKDHLKAHVEHLDKRINTMLDDRRKNEEAKAYREQQKAQREAANV